VHHRPIASLKSPVSHLADKDGRVFRTFLNRKPHSRCRGVGGRERAPYLRCARRPDGSLSVAVGHPAYERKPRANGSPGQSRPENAARGRPAEPCGFQSREQARPGTPCGCPILGQASEAAGTEADGIGDIGQVWLDPCGHALVDLLGFEPFHTRPSWRLQAKR